MLNDPLANTMSMIDMYNQKGRKEVTIHPVSSIILKTLKILQEEHYLGDAEQVAEHKGGVYKVNLLGTINRCGVIKPRYSVSVSDFEKFEKRYLPAKGMGILVVSTSQGLMTHEQAKEKNVGGRLIAYCY